MSNKIVRGAAKGLAFVGAVGLEFGTNALKSLITGRPAPMNSANTYSAKGTTESLHKKIDEHVTCRCRSCGHRWTND